MSDLGYRTEPRAYGVAVVGGARAGKSTIVGAMGLAIDEYYAQPGSAHVFSNSDAFRGITADALGQQGYDLDAGVDPSKRAEVGALAVGLFLDGYSPDDLKTMLDGYYLYPAPLAVRRSPGVNDTVQYVSDEPRVRQLVTDAGIRHLSRILDDPGAAGLEIAPRVVLLDARSQRECIAKFWACEVRPIATFVLTCDERTAARRNLMSTPDGQPRTYRQADLAVETARLQSRNEVDRRRSIGRMTLPRDLAPAHYLYPLLRDSADSGDLFALGTKLPDIPDGGVVIESNYIPRVTVSEALGPITRGALHAADR